MKSVTIKNQSCWGSFEEVNAENGFTISCIDEEKKASIFDLSQNECSKLIPKDGFENLWDKLMEINFQKVLLENESYQGCDGSYSIVEVSVGLQSLTLTLWCPDKEFYEECNLTESLKLLEVVYEFMDYAEQHQVAGGFEF